MPSSYTRACEGANKTKPTTKPTGSEPRDALAPLTRRSNPNQTHTVDGERGQDSSFECAPQLDLALVAPEEGIQPPPIALIASHSSPHRCAILRRSPSGSLLKH